MIDLTKKKAGFAEKEAPISKFRAGGLEGRLGSSQQAKIMIDSTKRMAGFAEKEAPGIIIKEKIGRKNEKTNENAKTTKKQIAATGITQNKAPAKESCQEGRTAKFCPDRKATDNNNIDKFGCAVWKLKNASMTT